MFYGALHLEERIHQVVKANDDKWKIIKRVNNNRISALTEMVRTQDHRIRLLETGHKKYREINLEEILEINRQLYENENRKQTNKAVNEFKKSEDAVLAAQTELGIWENEEELILEEEGTEENPVTIVNPSLATPMTPYHTPRTPLTPNTQGALYGAKPRAGASKFPFKGKKHSKIQISNKTITTNPKNLPLPNHGHK